MDFLAEVSRGDGGQLHDLLFGRYRGRVLFGLHILAIGRGLGGCRAEFQIDVWRRRCGYGRLPGGRRAATTRLRLSCRIGEYVIDGLALIALLGANFGAFYRVATAGRSARQSTTPVTRRKGGPGRALDDAIGIDIPTPLIGDLLGFVRRGDGGTQRIKGFEGCQARSEKFARIARLVGFCASRLDRIKRLQRGAKVADKAIQRIGRPPWDHFFFVFFFIALFVVLCIPLRHFLGARRSCQTAVKESGVRV